MFRVTREIDFCYGHRLLDYDGKCKHLHGHNGIAVIHIEGPQLDARGMLFDFGDIKREIKTWVDDHLDHKMLLHRDDPLVPILQGLNEPLFLMDANPTAENLAKLIFDLAVSKGFPVKGVDFHETPTCFAGYYRPGG